jgi:hypothetical protein
MSTVKMDHRKAAARMHETVRWMCTFLYECPKANRHGAFDVALNYYHSVNQLLDRYEGGYKSLFKKNRYKSPYVLIHIHMALYLHDEYELLQAYMEFIPVDSRVTYNKNGEILKLAKTAYDAEKSSRR